MPDFTFADNAVVKDIATVPEQYRSFYVQDGEQFKLADAEPVKAAVAMIGRLEASLKSERLMAKNRKMPDLTPLKDFGETPEQIVETFQAKLAEAQAAAKASGNEDLQRQIAKIKEDMAKAHSKDLEKYENRTKGLTGQLYTLMVENAATAAIGELKGVPELLLPFIKSQVKVEEQDGKYLVAVVDAQGDTRYSGVTGQPMTLKELVAEMKTNSKFQRLFDSDAPQSGTGFNPGSTNRVPMGNAGRELNSTEKIAAGLAKGQAAQRKRA